MRTKLAFFTAVAAMILSTACTTHYKVTGVTRTRLLIDNKYDKPMSDATATFMQPYKAKVDSQMAPVVGQTAKALESYRPESPMSNLMADMLMWSAKLYNEKPVFGVYNTGGIRASFAKGPITKGDIFDVAPFENKVCFITLSGDKVLELMGQIAYRGGEGVSREVRLKITKDNKLVSATIGGKEIDPSAAYRIVTIDYVSHGNDRMTAFKSGTDRRELTSDDDLTRTLLMKYIEECTANGKLVDADKDGRITIVE